MRPGKRTTIIDVAREAGVSSGTVSRAMNGGKNVKPHVRERVMAVVERLGYEPNSFAQNLRGQGARTVGCLVSDLSNPLHALFLTTVEEHLHTAGAMMLVANSRSLPNREQEIIAWFRMRQVNGLILTFGDEESAPAKDILTRTDIPLVVLDRDLPRRDRSDAALVDHRTGAILATRHLLTLGHRRIALLTPPPNIRPGRERIAGFTAAFQDFGLSVDPALVRMQTSANQPAFSEVRDLLDLAEPPTAIICLGTQMLAGVLTALASASKRVPDDISVIGIGDTDLVKLYSPPLTVVHWEIPTVATAAADMLLSRIFVDADVPPRRVLIPTEFIQRDSCAAPRVLMRRRRSA